MNIESVPSEAGPDLDGIEQGISNYKVRKRTTKRWFLGNHGGRSNLQLPIYDLRFWELSTPKQAFDELRPGFEGATRPEGGRQMVNIEYRARNSEL